jgi:hypothetical protein
MMDVAIVGLMNLVDGVTDEIVGEVLVSERRIGKEPDDDLR